MLAEQFGFKLNYANFGIMAFCVVYPQMWKVASQENEVARIEHLARAADELDPPTLHEIDQLDFRMVMINKPEPSRSHMLPKDGCCILERYLLERRGS
ncbi:MAG: hypothetical protein WAM53_16855 [Terrimicrobiaceae bacterium]